MYIEAIAAALMAFSHDCDLLLSAPERVVVREANRALKQSRPFLAELEIPEAPLLEVRRLTKKDKAKLGMFSLYDYAVIIDPNPFLKRASSDGLANLRAIFIHEYGHLIFFANMARYDKTWRMFYEYYTKDSKRRWAWLTGGEPGLPASYKLSKPYQELFADLLAVTVVDDPSVFHRSISMVSKSSDGLQRRFDRSVHRSHFNLEKYHDLLAPVRGYLWQNYLRSSPDQARDARFLAVVFDVIAREITERYADPKLIFLEPAQINLRLLRKLHEALAEFRQ